MGGQLANGGGIHAESTTMSFKMVVMEKNTCDGDETNNGARRGGALSLVNVEFECHSCLLRGNMAASGGALYARRRSNEQEKNDPKNILAKDYPLKIRLENTMFTHNVANTPGKFEAAGGAVVYDSAEVIHVIPSTSSNKRYPGSGVRVTSINMFKQLTKSLRVFRNYQSSPSEYKMDTKRCLRVALSSGWTSEIKFSTKKDGVMYNNINGFNKCLEHCTTLGYKYFGLTCPSKVHGIRCSCAGDLDDSMELPVAECAKKRIISTDDRLES